jgi:hypothetical protein
MRLPNASITSGRNSAPVTQMAVAHELADRDDVGQTARGAGSPHVLAEPPEVGLHPVGDEDAGLAHHLRARNPAGAVRAPLLVNMCPLKRDVAISFATYSLPVQATQSSMGEAGLQSEALINYLMRKTVEPFLHH